MRFYFTSLTDPKKIDGYIEGQMIPFFDRGMSPHQCEAVVLALTFAEPFVFNKAEADTIAASRLPVIVLDYCEYGWEASSGDLAHLHGFNTRTAGRVKFLREESFNNWVSLGDWLSSVRVVAYFKRELWSGLASVLQPPWPVFPLDYVAPDSHAAPPEADPSEYRSRKLEIFFQWGMSNPNRPRLHGALVGLCNDFGVDLAMCREAFDNSRITSLRHWGLFYSPWHTRTPITWTLATNKKAMVSVSVPGCGIKCFRHAEACNGAAMALPKDDLLWSYPWVHGENCIRFDADPVIAARELAALNADATLEPYKGSIATWRKYSARKYVSDYLIPLMKQVV